MTTGHHTVANTQWLRNPPNSLECVQSTRTFTQTDQCRTKIIWTTVVKRSFTPRLNTTETKKKMALYRQQNWHRVGVVDISYHAIRNKTTIRLIKVNDIKVINLSSRQRNDKALKINQPVFTRSIKIKSIVQDQINQNSQDQSRYDHRSTFKINQPEFTRSTKVRSIVWVKVPVQITGDKTNKKEKFISIEN